MLYEHVHNQTSGAGAVTNTIYRPVLLGAYSRINLIYIDIPQVSHKLHRSYAKFAINLYKSDIYQYHTDMHSVIWGLKHCLYCSGSIKSIASACVNASCFTPMACTHNLHTNYLLPYIALGSTTLCAAIPNRTACHIASSRRYCYIKHP